MALKQREGFTGRFGILAAAAGSAVGLGNIWRFPYVTGENGGGAFLIIYLSSVIIIGIPAILCEFVIGRKSQANALGAFRKLSPGKPWWLIGLMGILAAFVILSFYSTVAGWSLEYIYQAIIGGFKNKSTIDLTNDFANFTSSTIRPIFLQLIFMFITSWVVYAGIQKGIEKFTKILMPMLLVMIIIVCIRSISLEGSKKGLEFLFNPDFSKITFQTVLLALGQAAFSLSIGMGALITYGSYIKKDTPLIKVSAEVAIADTIIAILAGIMIFPALFALGESPAAGPGLVFITLPKIFNAMPGGSIFAILFFILLAVAALTSTISVLEVVVAYLVEEKKLSRKVATITGAVSISLIGVLCTISFGPLKDFLIFKKTIFDLMNYLSANILLTFGALFIIIYCGWILKKDSFFEEIKLSEKVRPSLSNTIFFIIKYIAPVAIGAIAIGAFFIEGLT